MPECFRKSIQKENYLFTIILSSILFSAHGSGAHTASASEIIVQEKVQRITHRSKKEKTISKKMKSRYAEFLEARFANPSYALKIGKEINGSLEKEIGVNNSFLLSIRKWMEEIVKEQKFSRENIVQSNEIRSWIYMSDRELSNLIKKDSKTTLRKADKHIQITKKLYGKSSLMYSGVVHKKIRIFELLGENKQVIKEVQRILPNIEKAHGKQSRIYCNSLYRLGVIYANQDTRESRIIANRFLIQSYNIYQKFYTYTLEENYDFLASLTNNTIELHLYKQQLECILKLKEIDSKINNSLENSFFCYNLGETYLKLGNYKSAIKNYKYCLKLLGNMSADSQEYCKAHTAISICEYRLGNWGKSVEHINLALAVKKIQKDTYSVEMLLCHKALAINRLGESKPAEKLLLKFHSALTKLRDKNELLTVEAKSDYVGVSNDLVNFYLDEKNYKMANKYAILSHQLLTKKLAEKYPITYMDCKELLGYSFLKLGKVKKAELYMNESLAICHQYLHKKHPQYGMKLIKLSELYLAQGKLDLANKNVLRGQSIIEESMGKESWFLLHGLEVQVKLARKSNRNAEADDFETKANNIRKLLK